MTITKEIREAMARVLDQRHVSEKTAQDILLICKNGLTAKEALQMRGENNPNKDTLTNLKKKSERWMLSSPDLQKLSYNTVRDTLKMKPIEVRQSPDNEKKDYIYPTVSNRLAAAAMVTDRTEPVKQDHGPGSVTNNIQVNVRQYDRPDAIAQHVVAEITGQDVSEPESI